MVPPPFHLPLEGSGSLKNSSLSPEFTLQSRLLGVMSNLSVLAAAGWVKMWTSK